jgi:DNA-binding NtrC family response regulator
MQCLLEARECYRAIGLTEAEAEVLLDIADEDIRQRAVDRAAERLALIRQLRADVANGDALDEKIAVVYRRVEQALISNAIAARVTLDAQDEMGRLLRSDRSFTTKLSEFLRVLARTIPCDGACVLDIAEHEATLLGAHGIDGIEVGARVTLPDEFAAVGWPESLAPLVFLGLDTEGARGIERLSRGRAIASALALPLRQRRSGAWSVLYVDRSSMSANSQFQQAEVGHCINLSNQLAGFLEEANIRDRRGLREFDNIDRNIALADIVTESPKMQAILGLVSRVADSDLTVLLQGETGTGKKLLARALHMCSPRSEAEFVTVDCASLPENILESELFGHVKGTFTGATADRGGLLERADGGTVFLDEIDKAGQAVQQRFLHLLDCGEIRAVGGREYKKLNIRVVCATSAPDLAAEVDAGRFIKDLYYRLNDINIVVPPLRERREDVSLLCEYFIDVFSQDMAKSVRGFSQFAMKRMLDFDWPGNVRELEKVVRRAVTLADADEVIGIDLLPGRMQQEEIERPIAALGAPGTLKEKLESIERELVTGALEEHGWNKSRAAVALGLSRKGLKNKIARYGLDRRS